MRKILLIIFVCLAQFSEAINIDISSIPFSYYGAYTAFSTKGNSEMEKGLFLHDVSGPRLWKPNAIWNIEPVSNGKVLPSTYECNPSQLIIKTAEGTIFIAYQNADIIRIKSTGKLGVRVTQQLKEDPFVLIPISRNQHRVLCGNSFHYLFTTLHGSSSITGSAKMTHWEDKSKPIVVYDIMPDSEGSEFVIETYLHEWVPKVYDLNYETVANNAGIEFQKALMLYPSVTNVFESTLEQAAYLNWINVVKPLGLFKRPGLLCTKNRMHGMWSWDHCFSALGLSYSNQALAKDQFLFPFDFQNEMGSIPDLMSNYHMVYPYCKPPVHGWIWKKMIDNNLVVSKTETKDVYAKLVKWTEFYIHYKDDDKDGLMQYNHGYDSGWDNATTFDSGFPIEGVDLNTFMILQMETLSELALKLCKKKEAKKWKLASEKLLNVFITKCWDGERFKSYKSNSEEYTQNSQSLLQYIPILLGKRLPDSIRVKLIMAIKTSGIITEYGLATENPKSVLYESDGYWRGPIWAPTTLLIIEGLEESGEKVLAKELANKFCLLCKENGFSENFDALTGKPLRDMGYNWTVGVFLRLVYTYKL